jgi:outer membrane protein TolC
LFKSNFTQKENMPKQKNKIRALVAAFFLVTLCGNAATNQTATNLIEWINRPLSLADAINVALQNNLAIQKAQTELQAAHGISLQTRAIAIPRVQANGNFTANDPNSIEQFPFGGPRINLPDQNWSANIEIVQSIYEGGRIVSGLRAAKLTTEQAVLNYQTTVADALLRVRLAYYDALLAEQLISVQEASVNLLERELNDQQQRLEAGTVPQFNVLRAEVELANAKPRLIRARNSYRIAKNDLINLLGYNVPKNIWENIPLILTDKLHAEPYEIQLPDAIARALENRTEIASLRKQEGLQREAITVAKAGRKPSVQLFAGYGGRNSSFTDDLTETVNGWTAGAQVNWNIFDGFRTKGRIEEAQARYARAQLETVDTARAIELEVRTAYSNFIEAREVLESQKKVQEQAEEALRLATSRNQAGAGTQLDVLSAQTALTEARSTQAQALHDYEVAKARLQRAIGIPLKTN